jgi:hypothetical protein
MARRGISRIQSTAAIAGTYSRNMQMAGTGPAIAKFAPLAD